MDYHSFINKKRHTILDQGFDPGWYPNEFFDYQRSVTKKALISGRKGVFLDTGLGKTRVQLTIAENLYKKTGKPVLIVTPLAVAFQFIAEAETIGTSFIEYCKDGHHTCPLVLTNYERLKTFLPSDFCGVVLDESSILKNFDGKIKKQVNDFIRKVEFRFLSSATPSPNSHTELGNSSEALGFMGYTDMLGMFFKNNQNSTDTRTKNVGEKYYLKPHAENDFFNWVSQWAIMARKPSDLGFDDKYHVLPKLNEFDEFVGGAPIDEDMKLGFQDIRSEQKESMVDRCEKAVDIASGNVSVYWVNTNAENDLIKELDKESECIIGSMSLDKKEDILLNFQKGNIKRLITKASMTSMGLNWQHCNHTVYFPTFSYEQKYQAFRRFWRFGQKREVNAFNVMSPSQSVMMRAMREKKKKADELYERLTSKVNGTYIEKPLKTINEIKIPEFLK